ncbi:golgin subfamily B member 1 isoform X2 [Hemicordylus capensis]|uniref:golgin subfamily B member 1 isoform X2 n=1 Tax=Hemicordylus capensis TaxID=884348 RepID=UPI002302051E|nr:golgin subfamily B member 1 isoform X2 [Hemicordylus capensis]
MLSRLSGLANTVLQELSGEGEDAGAGALPAGPDLEPSQQNGEEMPEDVLERLAHMERLVVQLKDLLREKEDHLQQKDALLQEERQAAEAKLTKLKLQAKAKLASLNKRIEELTEQGAALPAKDLPGEPLPPAKLQSDQGTNDVQREEMEALQRRLQEQEETVRKLQEQLEVATGSLKEAKAQLSSLEEEIQEKDSQLEEQARQHQAALHQLVAPSALEAEMQQNLRLCQRKLEEQEAALLGRAQVVELLQQELNGAEEQKKVLLEKWQQAEAELDSLRSAFASERQESRSLVEKLELELAEQKLAAHRLQEEVQQLSQEQADGQHKHQAREKRHAEQMEEKSLQIAALQRAEQELRASYDALQAKKAQLQWDADQLPERPPEKVSGQPGELPAQPTESGCSPAAPETATWGSTMNEPAADHLAASPVRSDRQQETEQDKTAVEALEADNETLRAKLAVLEKRLEFAAGPAESSQVSCTEIGVGMQGLLASEAPSSFSGSSRGPVGILDGLENDMAEGPPSPGMPAAQAQPSPGENPEELPATENSPSEILEYPSAKKHKDLSVLLVELQEAQEEMAFLKGQLQDSSSPVPDGAEELSVKLQASDSEGGGEKGTALLQSASSSRSMIRVEIQDDSPSPILVIPMEQEGPLAGDPEAAPQPPLASASQLQELAKLQFEIAELQASQQKAEQLHQEVLEEKAVEIGRLQRLVEDSGCSLHTLARERDQLLAQLQELFSLAELKEQVRQLEGDLANAEKRRLSDYESGISQLGLLKEQIQSLQNEARSKEVKIETLQRDLDEAQCGLAEQETLGRNLTSRLQEKEQEMHTLVAQLEETVVRGEQLSQRITARELEVARLDSLVCEKSAEVDRLQREVVEQQQQMVEVSTGMSDRMVELNEEKFLLGKELKSMTEQLSLLVQAKEMRDQGVGTEEKESPGQQAERAASAGEELEGLRKENEQVRKKLQAALLSRKELLSKVRRLEREAEAGRGQPGATALEAQDQEGEESPPTRSSIHADGTLSPGKRSRTDSLSQVLSAKEAELQMVLGEKESAEAKLQNMAGELQQSLQEKGLLIGSLQAELEEKGLLIGSLQAELEEKGLLIGSLQAELEEKGLLIGSLQAELKDHHPAPVSQSSEGPGRPAPLAHLASSTTDPGLEEQQKTALEEKICALEQEGEQLQKKLQEALASRKDTIKKAQEKDRHHREQLKQQKEDYNLLQEQLEEQSREKESIQNQLLQLQAQIEMLESSSLPKPGEEAPPDGTQPAPGPAEELGREVPADLQAESAAVSGSFLAAEGVTVEQLKADLSQLRAEKRELEAQASQLQGELGSKSEVALQLQKQVGQLRAEAETVKAALCQAEANVASLRLELEDCRAEAARQESLWLQHTDRGEQKEPVSKEEVESLNSQLALANESLHSLQAELQERGDVIQALEGQLEVEKKHARHLQTELAQVQQKSAEGAAEEEQQPKAQLQRKLQAALISRKEVLKESKGLREELASTRTSLESASLRLSDVERQASVLEKEKGVLSEKLLVLQEEREKLIAEVDKALVGNQNLAASCESLKLALEGVTREKTSLEEEVGALQRCQAEELSAWQEKHKELQKEYETLLRSYENVSDEAERIQRVLEGVRQEKQELFLKLKGAEAEKREVDTRLQGAEQEMEGMREKMRKFAKSKQQKILELEEENERLRAEAHPADSGPGSGEELSTHLREDLESSKKHGESLSGQLKVLMAEKDSLNQEIQDLRQRLQSKEQEGVVAESKAAPSTVAAEGEVDPGAGSEPPEPTALHTEEEAEEETSKAGPVHDGINGYMQQVTQLTRQVAELEKRSGSAEELSRLQREGEALREQKRSLEDLLAAKAQDLEALQGEVAQLQEAHRHTKEQLAGASRRREALEREKDDLEERLMNQLAELNGSIGNYQQDVGDLQSKNQQLQKEVASLQGTLSCLQDEKQQLLREKAEKKEQVAMVKSTWKGDSGRTQARELQELLKEKQQEVRQLQKDCIKSQEKISSLERTIKALEFVQSESQKELEAARRSLAKAGDDTQKAQAELASCRVLLDDTQSEAARVLAESLKAREELRASQEQVQAQLRQKEEDLGRRLEQEKSKHSKELRNLEERLEALRQSQLRSEEAAQALQDSLRRKDQDAQQLQGTLNHTLAQLAAFSRSMSSLQDDRDRVIDESRLWEKKFSEAIEKKEQEVRAREEACVALEAQAKQKAAQAEELQNRIASLEESKLAQESRAQQELQHHQEEAQLLQEEKRQLASQLEETQRLFDDSQKQLQKQEGELQSLRKKLADLQGSLAKCEEARQETEVRVKHQDATLQECRFGREQLEADLRASKELTERLHEEMSSKDQKILSLLASKEEAVAAAVSELQLRHQEELGGLEKRLGQGEEERAALETERTRALEKASRLVGKLKSTREESKQHKAQLDSFTKSMFSLQDDRDRVLGDYQQLEQRHVAAILEKDQLIQEAAAENNTLKGELRTLHGRMDDLHAENAKLGAELVRYREDLNQLISIKDSQQKQLLQTQLERIQVLEKEKAGAEGKLRDSEQTLAELRLSVEALQQVKHSMEQETETLAASLSRVQGEMAALREGGPMLELQAQLQGKVDEVQELSSRLSRAQQRGAELEEELALAHKTTAQERREAEAKMEKELKELHHDAGLMRSETETAEERVAELAKDLLEMEQNLLALTEENQDLKAQIQSFGKAMGSLQDSWDQSNEELRAMEKKYAVSMEEQRSLVQSLREENSRCQEEQKHLLEEREALVSQLGALRGSVEEKGLLARLEKLSQQLQEKDVELLRLASELEGASAQVTSFSKAMASLQGERDHLLSELDKARRVDEVKLQSAGRASASPVEVKSLKKALSTLQNDRDRLLAELKSLQQQYLQVGLDTAELVRLKAQLREQEQETEQQRQERASRHLELQQLREEKAAWEQREATAAQEQQLSCLQGAVRESRPRPQEEQHQRQIPPAPLKEDASSLEAEMHSLQAQLGSSLKEVHRKELRIQELNSKLSQVFEEKNFLSLQLRGSSCSLRESHQRYSEALAHCEALERQLQALQPPAKEPGSLSTDAAPGAPQERSENSRESYTPELQELQTKLSEAKQQQSRARQGLLQLEELLQEERDRRLAAEEAFSAAQDHIRRMEANEWAHPSDTSIEMSPSPEHALLVSSMDGSFSKARGGTGLRRVLRLLFGSRRRLPLLATVYLLAVHVLLLLCLTGHL